MTDQTNPEERTMDTAPEGAGDAGFEAGLAGGEEQARYIVKYNGQEMEMGLEELITNAQKGLNYDHVKGERDALRAQLAGGEDGFAALARAYPDLQKLPEAVAAAIAKGAAPLEAYREYENQMLREELARSRQETRNRALSLGSVSGEGAGEADDFLSGFDSI
ncbi:hypothetical protein H8699_09780 [Christensenellaceae bacterium NSJ-44]|uniref:Uncharacterized protein n=1 Tax=Luoshenia tenuis TaxID=2763654 RepID=A0A926D1A3_9FIRM|nr:hypothetical protein [Luoshenia tenuis]MBC8529717.1 hypothetical protein [Luoshenia tenuis]